MTEVQKFAPTVMTADGPIVLPGWMWTIVYAAAGFEWAIKQADEPQFKARIREHNEREKSQALDRRIASLEKQLEELKAQRASQSH